MDPLARQVASRSVRARRPIPVNKAQAKAVVTELIDSLREWLPKQEEAPLGNKHLWMGYGGQHVRLKDVQGRWKSIDVNVYAVDPGSDYMPVSLGGSFQNGTHPEIHLNINGKLTPSQLLFVLGTVEHEFYSTLIHEMTHASDILLPGTFKVQPGEGVDPSDAYYNDPNELRAWMQQVVDDVTSQGWVTLGLKGSLGRNLVKKFPKTWRQEAIERALGQSSKWKQIQRHLIPASRKKILQAVYQAMEPYLDAVPIDELALKVAAKAEKSDVKMKVTKGGDKITVTPQVDGKDVGFLILKQVPPPDDLGPVDLSRCEKNLSALQEKVFGDNPAPVWYVVDVELNEEYRGKGLGLKMYELALKKAKPMVLITDRCKGMSTSEDAMRVWEKLKKKYPSLGSGKDDSVLAVPG